MMALVAVSVERRGQKASSAQENQPSPTQGNRAFCALFHARSTVLDTFGRPSVVSRRRVLRRSHERRRGAWSPVALLAAEAICLEGHRRGDAAEGDGGADRAADRLRRDLDGQHAQYDRIGLA